MPLALLCLLLTGLLIRNARIRRQERLRTLAAVRLLMRRRDQAVLQFCVAVEELREECARNYELTLELDAYREEPSRVRRVEMN